MKAEEWLLGNEIGFPFEYTCSCDCAKLDPLFDSIWLCRQCGSTLLSIWAAEMAGVFDPRKFYDRNVNISMMEKPIKGKTKHMEISDIVKRMLLPSKQDYIKMESVLKKS